MLPNTGLIPFVKDRYCQEFIIEKLIPQVDRLPRNTALKIVAHYFLVKATKTLGAICLLSGAGYGEDAQVLSRTLFELAVNLAYFVMPDEESEREERAKAFICDDEKQQESKRMEMERLGEDRKCSDWISEMKASTQAMPAQNHSCNAKPRESLQNMVRALGEPYECYWHFLYWSLSKLAHPSGLGSYSYLQSDDEGGEIHRALAAGFDFHWRIATAAVSIFGLNSLKEILDDYCRQWVEVTHPSLV